MQLSMQLAGITVEQTLEKCFYYVNKSIHQQIYLFTNAISFISQIISLVHADIYSIIEGFVFKKDSDFISIVVYFISVCSCLAEKDIIE